MPDGIQWISSHPALKERVQFVTENAGDSLNEVSINLDWSEFKKSLK